MPVVAFVLALLLFTFFFTGDLGLVSSSSSIGGGGVGGAPLDPYSINNPISGGSLANSYAVCNKLSIFLFT